MSDGLLGGLQGSVGLGEGPDGVIAGGDLASAYMVVLDTLMSGSGLARVVAGTLTANESAALALLEDDTTVVPLQTQRLLRQTGLITLNDVEATYDNLFDIVVALDAS
jgi:hypothetical protein